MAQDKMVRGLLAHGNVQFTAISGKALVEAARETHGLSRLCSAALGRTLLCCCMMGTHLKNGRERVSAIVKGGGPAGNIVCTAWKEGGDTMVKGYIENPSLELPLRENGKLDVGGGVGSGGELIVTRDLSLREPYVGHVPMVSGEIAEDFAQYFTVSEQQPSLVYLGVHVAADTGEVRSAGGLIVQPLPDCPPETLDALQGKAVGIGALSGLLEKKELEQALCELLGDMELQIQETSLPLYHCDCSRERLEQVLISLGEEELNDMIENDHQAEVKCHFCNTVYTFDAEEMKKLLAEAKERV